MIARKPRHLDLRQPDGALRETTINSNGSGAIVALQAKKVNRNPTGRPTERGMVPQSARHGKSAIKKRRHHSHLRFALSSTLDLNPQRRYNTGGASSQKARDFAISKSRTTCMTLGDGGCINHSPAQRHVQRILCRAPIEATNADEPIFGATAKKWFASPPGKPSVLQEKSRCYPRRCYVAANDPH